MKKEIKKILFANSIRLKRAKDREGDGVRVGERRKPKKKEGNRKKYR